MNKRKKSINKPKSRNDSPMESRKTDPQGSYTGTPAKDDEPVQDADDL